MWATPVNEIGDFGIGILLYFKMLISLTILCTVLGLASIYNIHYFDTDEYSNSQPSLPNFSILHGSAVCDNYEPVCTADPCTCTYTDGDPTIVGSDCAVRFNCPLRLEQGYADLVIAAAFLLFNIYMGFKHAKITTKADEAEQTAQDYAIMVNDPNPDATDPDEWHKFFKQFGHVSYVTVAINNGKLLRLLSRRKQCMQMLGYESGQKKKTEDERAEYDVAENDELYQALSPAAKKLSGIVQWRYRMSRADDQVSRHKQLPPPCSPPPPLLLTHACRRSSSRSRTAAGTSSLPRSSWCSRRRRISARRSRTSRSARSRQ